MDLIEPFGGTRASHWPPVSTYRLSRIFMAAAGLDLCVSPEAPGSQILRNFKRLWTNGRTVTFIWMKQSAQDLITSPPCMHFDCHIRGLLRLSRIIASVLCNKHGGYPENRNVPSASHNMADAEPGKKQLRPLIEESCCMFGAISTLVSIV